MKIPARRYRITLLCLLLVLSGFTIYADKALEATRGSQAGLLERLVGGSAATAKPAPKPAANTGGTRAAALTNDVFTTPGEPADETFDPTLAPAQSGGSFNITQAILPGGGGTSTGGTNSLTGALGQGVTGNSTGGNFALGGGFFGGGAGGGCPTITVNVPGTNTGTTGVAFSQNFTQTGGAGTVTFTRTGALPTGINLATNGLLSGTPTQMGSFPITVTATDSNQCTGSANYTLTINCQTITVNLPGTNTGTAGVFFSQNFTRTGGSGTVNFTLNSGTPPTGIALATNGTLSGTTAQTGSFPLTVKATDANNCMGVSATYTLTINPMPCPTITVNPSNPTLTAGTMGTPYNQTFTQTGGAGTLTWSNPGGGLPNGLALNSSTGVLSGTPTAQGTFNFTMRVTDGNQCTGERAYSLVINPMPCPTITVNPSNPTLTAGTVGTPYSQTFTQAGGAGTLTWSNPGGGLPNGLALNSSTGVLSGTPTATGTAMFTVRVTDANQCTGERQYTLTINPASNGLQFYPLSQPLRIFDTRAGQGPCDNVGAPITGGTAISVQARLTCLGITIPANAQAVVGNITVINGSGQIGFLTLFPSGQPLPLAANMIYVPGDILSNAFTVGLSNDGRFSIFGERTIDVVVDVSGYYAPPQPTGLYFHPLPRPLRIMDTRPGGPCDNVGTPITGGTSLVVPARLNCDGITIPAAAQAIVGNATVVNGSGQLGFLTIYPNGVPLPLAANMVYFPGAILSNAFTVSLSNDGRFNIFGERTIDMVVDVAGYYSTEANDVNGPGLLFNSLPRPLRIMDTRAGQDLCDNVTTPITGGTSLAVPGRLTCDGVTIPAAAQAVLGNFTVINTTAQIGFLTLHPDGVPLPLAANMVYFPNQLLSNAFVVGLNAMNGQFRIFGERTIHGVVDVSGYFAP